MKNIKTIIATAALGAFAVLGTSGCAGPQYAQVPGEQMEQASFVDQSSSGWVDRGDYISLSSEKAWPASASNHYE
jgi:hypothetical protein